VYFLEWFGRSARNFAKMLSVLREQGISFPEGWYSITQADLIMHNGSGLLHLYKNSILNMLKNIYPDVPWLPWKFVKVSHPSVVEFSIRGVEATGRTL
jgi:hypothetical protein